MEKIRGWEGLTDRQTDGVQRGRIVTKSCS